MVKNNLKNTTSGKKIDFPIPVSSYKMILIGFGIIILGFILMMGGGSDNPAEFNYDIFSFRRITLAPIVVLMGFGFVFGRLCGSLKRKWKKGRKIRYKIVG